jgi:general stress protein YciG
MTKQLRGFALMTPERRREIASKGGKAVPAAARSYSQNPELAARSGRLGGTRVPPDARSFSQDRALASAAGRKGGEKK